MRFQRVHGVAVALVALSVLLSACQVDAAGGQTGNDPGASAGGCPHDDDARA